MKRRELIKMLTKNDFYEDRSNGSHLTFKNDRTNKITQVPIHSGDIDKSLVCKILKQAGLK